MKRVNEMAFMIWMILAAFVAMQQHEIYKLKAQNAILKSIIDRHSMDEHPPERQ